MMYIDKDVVIGLKNHDENAFNIFYEKYKKLLFFIIVSIVKNEDVSYDLLQDCFIKVYKNVSSLRDDRTFHSWVGLVAKNTALDYLKKRRDDYLDEDVLLNICIEQPTPYISYDFNKYLSNKESLIVIYNIIYEYTFKEIANMLNMQLSQVYSIYKQATKKMKEYYKKEGHL